MLLPRRPPQSRARHHVRAEDITEIAALSHAEVLRPIPARRFLEESPETLSGGALSPVPPAVDECVRPSAPCSRCLALWHCCCQFFGSPGYERRHWSGFSSVCSDELSV